MQDRVIALGFFDGVHLGHGALMKKAKERAEALHAASAVFTFDRPPKEVLSGKKVELINSAHDRTVLLRELYGMEDVIAAPFDQRMRTMAWDDFVEEVLLRELHAVHLVCGDDHHFGYRGEGTPEKLREKCRELGIGCDVIGQVEIGGQRVSSTAIRAQIAAGEMERAAEFLGHPHMLTGCVEHGQGIGHTIGVPTINLAVPDGVVVPKFGVYAAQVNVEGGGSYLAVTNVGVRPTVGESSRVTVEPFLLDFSGDLYGRNVELCFYRYLRPERKFPDLAALAAQIKEDEQATRDYFA